MASATAQPPPSALSAYTNAVRARQPVLVIFYRGERSRFCRAWLRRWLAIPALDERLSIADATVLFVSAQSQGKAYSVAAGFRQDGTVDFQRVLFLGDPTHDLARYLSERGLVHPIVTNPDGHRAHAWVYDYGMVQPAVLAVAGGSGRDLPTTGASTGGQREGGGEQVLFHWAMKPSFRNAGGKLERPDPWEVWDFVERKLDRIRFGEGGARSGQQRKAPENESSGARYARTSKNMSVDVEDTVAAPGSACEPMDESLSLPNEELFGPTGAAALGPGEDGHPAALTDAQTDGQALAQQLAQEDDALGLGVPIVDNVEVSQSSSRGVDPTKTSVDVEEGDYCEDGFFDAVENRSALDTAPRNDDAINTDNEISVPQRRGTVTDIVAQKESSDDTGDNTIGVSDGQSSMSEEPHGEAYEDEDFGRVQRVQSEVMVAAEGQVGRDSNHGEGDPLEMESATKQEGTGAPARSVAVPASVPAQNPRSLPRSPTWRSGPSPRGLADRDDTPATTGTTEEIISEEVLSKDNSSHTGWSGPSESGEDIPIPPHRPYQPEAGSSVTLPEGSASTAPLQSPTVDHTGRNTPPEEGNIFPASSAGSDSVPTSGPNYQNSQAGEPESSLAHPVPYPSTSMKTVGSGVIDTTPLQSVAATTLRYSSDVPSDGLSQTGGRDLTASSGLPAVGRPEDSSALTFDDSEALELSRAEKSIETEAPRNVELAGLSPADAEGSTNPDVKAVDSKCSPPVPKSMEDVIPDAASMRGVDPPLSHHRTNVSPVAAAEEKTSSAVTGDIVVGPPSRPEGLSSTHSDAEDPAMRPMRVEDENRMDTTRENVPGGPTAPPRDPVRPSVSIKPAFGDSAAVQPNEENSTGGNGAVGVTVDSQAENAESTYVSNAPLPSSFEPGHQATAASDAAVMDSVGEATRRVDPSGMLSPFDVASTENGEDAFGSAKNEDGEVATPRPYDLNETIGKARFRDEYDETEFDEVYEEYAPMPPPYRRRSFGENWSGSEAAGPNPTETESSAEIDARGQGVAQSVPVNSQAVAQPSASAGPDGDGNCGVLSSQLNKEESADLDGDSSATDDEAKVVRKNTFGKFASRLGSGKNILNPKPALSDQDAEVEDNRPGRLTRMLSGSKDGSRPRSFRKSAQNSILPGSARKAPWKRETPEDLGGKSPAAGVPSREPAPQAAQGEDETPENATIMPGAQYSAMKDTMSERSGAEKVGEASQTQEKNLVDTPDPTPERAAAGPTTPVAPSGWATEAAALPTERASVEDLPLGVGGDGIDQQVVGERAAGGEQGLEILDAVPIISIPVMASTTSPEGRSLVALEANEISDMQARIEMPVEESAVPGVPTFGSRVNAEAGAAALKPRPLKSLKLSLLEEEEGMDDFSGELTRSGTGEAPAPSGTADVRGAIVKTDLDVKDSGDSGVLQRHDHFDDADEATAKVSRMESLTKRLASVQNRFMKGRPGGRDTRKGAEHGRGGGAGSDDGRTLVRNNTLTKFKSRLASSSAKPGRAADRSVPPSPHTSRKTNVRLSDVSSEEPDDAALARQNSVVGRVRRLFSRRTAGDPMMQSNTGGEMGGQRKRGLWARFGRN